MSTRVHLSLLLGLVVVATLFIVWISMRHAVFGPFSRKLVKAQVDQVVFVADEIEQGVEPQALARKLGLRVRFRRELPKRVQRMLKRGYGRCRPKPHPRRKLVVCRGPHPAFFARLPTGWLSVRREHDFGGPERRIIPILVLIAAVVTGFSMWIAGRITRPLRASEKAMGRIAQGDLSHRLPLEGNREFVELARVFNHMADRLERALRAERELMAGISHELRTPLARLRLEIELLRDEQVPPKRLDAMEADLRELDDLIAELLEISKLSLGQNKPSLAPVDLWDVASEAVERETLPKHEVKITGAPSIIDGDQRRLVRALANLVQNAGKYAPPGTAVEVEVGPGRLTVKDRGPGVAPGELTKLFEPFYRGARGRASPSTGIGLGLMIARQVALIHGGTVVAENRDGGGLIMTMTLPTPDKPLKPT